MANGSLVTTGGAGSVPPQAVFSSLSSLSALCFSVRSPDFEQSWAPGTQFFAKVFTSGGGWARAVVSLSSTRPLQLASAKLPSRSPAHLPPALRIHCSSLPIQAKAPSDSGKFKSFNTRWVLGTSTFQAAIPNFFTSKSSSHRDRYRPTSTWVIFSRLGHFTLMMSLVWPVLRNSSQRVCTSCTTCRRITGLALRRPSSTRASISCTVAESCPKESMQVHRQEYASSWTKSSGSPSAPTRAGRAALT
mmetsp:Transcript_17111/g.36971  ORF Transcript_17111/g.36971 Transcript_17111/m.36971 type:complete len:247 (-) Transcript_17111:143-883(-)